MIFFLCVAKSFFDKRLKLSTVKSSAVYNNRFERYFFPFLTSFREGEKYVNFFFFFPKADTWGGKKKNEKKNRQKKEKKTSFSFCINENTYGLLILKGQSKQFLRSDKHQYKFNSIYFDFLFLFLVVSTLLTGKKITCSLLVFLFSLSLSLSLPLSLFYCVVAKKNFF